MIVYIAGNNGSGKTTLAAGLASRLGFVHAQEHVYDESYLLDLFTQQRRWSFETQIHFLVLKIEAVRRASAEAERVIIDRSPYEDAEVFARYFYETGKMDRRSYRTYQQLYDNISEDLADPVLVLYCRCSVPELAQRISGRGRAYEALYPKDHLSLLENLYTSWLNRMIMRFPGKVMIVDSEAVDFKRDPAAMDQLAREVADLILYSPQLSLFGDGREAQSIPADLRQRQKLLRIAQPQPGSERLGGKLVAYLAAPFTGKASEIQPAVVTPREARTTVLFEYAKDSASTHGRIHDTEYRAYLEYIESVIRSAGYDTVLPHRDVNKWGNRRLTPDKAASECTRHVFSSDVLIAAPQISLGAHYEIGVAIGYGLPVVLLIKNDDPMGFLMNGLGSVNRTVVLRFDSTQELRTRLVPVLNDLAKRLRP